MPRQSPSQLQNDMTVAEFEALFEAVSTWGRWGADDERGALNHLTPERVRAASGLVREGRSVSMSLPLNTSAAPDNPEPALHHMTMLGDTDIGSGSLRFAKDFVGVDYHNDGHTHLDALCHVSWAGRLYNGVPSDAVGSQGASFGAVEVLRDGLVGRGVLLDVPRLRGLPWLEPGEHVRPEDLEAAEAEQGVAAGEGDVLLVRTGHARRLAELGPWDTARAKAGLHPSAARLLAERGISALGSDGNNDTAPSTTEGVGFPIHVLALSAIGIPLFDYLQLEDIADACAEAGRWEFLFVAAPLRIVNGTGSPLNPIAVL
ncbi:MAG: cyclase family protein [Solirubrobacteraceae bacterium]